MPAKKLSRPLPDNIAERVAISAVRIRELREKYSLSTLAMASLLGCSDTGLGRIEKGIAAPGSDLLMRLRVYFCISVDYLLGFTEDSHESQIFASEVTAFMRSPDIPIFCKHRYYRDCSGNLGLRALYIQTARDIIADEITADHNGDRDAFLADCTRKWQKLPQKWRDSFEPEKALTFLLAADENLYPFGRKDE